MRSFNEPIDVLGKGLRRQYEDRRRDPHLLRCMNMRVVKGGLVVPNTVLNPLLIDPDTGLGLGALANGYRSLINTVVESSDGYTSTTGGSSRAEGGSGSGGGGKFGGYGTNPDGGPGSGLEDLYGLDKQDPKKVPTNLKDDIGKYKQDFEVFDFDSWDDPLIGGSLGSQLNFDRFLERFDSWTPGSLWSYDAFRRSWKYDSAQLAVEGFVDDVWTNFNGTLDWTTAPILPAFVDVYKRSVTDLIDGDTYVITLAYNRLAGGTGNINCFVGGTAGTPIFIGSNNVYESHRWTIVAGSTTQVKFAGTAAGCGMKNFTLIHVPAGQDPDDVLDEASRTLTHPALIRPLIVDHEISIYIAFWCEEADDISTLIFYAGNASKSFILKSNSFGVSKSVFICNDVGGQTLRLIGSEDTSTIIHIAYGGDDQISAKQYPPGSIGSF